MTTLETTYDQTQHCVMRDTAKGKSVAMDCPHTGKGEELSPGNLLIAAVSGCMLLAMGAVAMRNDLDLTGTTVGVDVERLPPPKLGYTAMAFRIRMPAGIPAPARNKLQRAAEACPIKNSIDPAIAVSVDYIYPD
jgi:putative redox protein